ncbi:MAG: argininosuccinate synthase, partial [Ktedonobacterales bacterium]
MADRVVLAYSGGLDTSVAIRWLQETYGLETIALTIDVGNERDIPAIATRARTIGATKALTIDARRDFLEYFVWPALQAGALYEGAYPLATALARPLIAKLLVDTARREGATAVAHGCTGKGNDQVRFDVSVMALAPDLKIIAPVREWSMTRDAEIAYAQQHSIPVPVTSASPYSVDANLWGRSIECGILEDPWAEPPSDVWQWTDDPAAELPPTEITLTFEHGIPVALDGEELDSVTLVQRLNAVAGKHGVGRIDHVENRLVGIKSREVYEAPAAITLLTAHRALEGLTLSREQVRELIPFADFTNARFPIRGGLLQPRGGTIRHDAVAWGYARGADARGVDIIQQCEVTGFQRDGNRITAVQTTRGTIRAKKVGLAVAGHSGHVAGMAGFRLPIETHVLQALVSEPLKPVLDTVVTSGAVHFYISQSDKGELVMGGDIDGYNSY